MRELVEKDRRITVVPQTLNVLTRVKLLMLNRDILRLNLIMNQKGL